MSGRSFYLSSPAQGAQYQGSPCSSRIRPREKKHPHPDPCTGEEQYTYELWAPLIAAIERFGLSLQQYLNFGNLVGGIIGYLDDSEQAHRGRVAQGFGPIYGMQYMMLIFINSLLIFLPALSAEPKGCECDTSKWVCCDPKSDVKKHSVVKNDWSQVLASIARSHPIFQSKQGYLWFSRVPQQILIYQLYVDMLYLILIKIFTKWVYKSTCSTRSNCPCTCCSSLAISGHQSDTVILHTIKNDLMKGYAKMMVVSERMAASEELTPHIFLAFYDEQNTIMRECIQGLFGYVDDDSDWIESMNAQLSQANQHRPTTHAVAQYIAAYTAARESGTQNAA